MQRKLFVLVGIGRKVASHAVGSYRDFKLFAGRGDVASQERGQPDPFAEHPHRIVSGFEAAQIRFAEKAAVVPGVVEPEQSAPSLLRRECAEQHRSLRSELIRVADVELRNHERLAE